ncbi:flagellar biosynthetic protein FlhB [Paucidesulfovibrio gracilis DSM 16080]|uniref:Flagellar biosynthetic protein FlhB n=1 Tax=Paucidesulfovibrio gracilis DSM 16080 TaxID=1121449 RepID=A0A1T4XDL2_9BACT|nr:flagellar biosynthesis protein FlhB [Paucidesulfovibrio gracilis]SKA87081.1 flagellar biosynthetic protein FlhB [Paucidesulfovibrio gracilis DSM 16080]
MAFGQEDPSKTEKATPKRRKKARGEGNVPKSSEMSKVMTLLTGVIMLRIMVPYFYERLGGIYRWSLHDAVGMELDKQRAYELFVWCVKEIALLVMPILLVVALIAFLTMRLQVGQLWTTKVFKPKWGRMFNLVKGIKRLMISPQALFRLGKSVGQAVAVGIAPVIILRQEYPKLITLFDMTPEAVAVYILSIGYKMACYALIPMLIIGIIDLIYNRWNYEEQLKMTKDEIKDERKQAEGDPEVRAEQRKKMMESMAQRMMESVPKADVVVTNPVHLAIALSYNPLDAPAPLVLAKGSGATAERIKDIAREHNIPIREDKPLAQALYKQVEIGDTIPEELFQAVAAILARLDKFRANR